MTDIETKALFCKPTHERALLAFCMRNIDNYYDLKQNMTERDFLYEDHSVVFTMMSTLMDKGYEKIDLPLLINEAQTHGVLKSMGGVDYLQSISNMNISGVNFKSYLQEVLETTTKYRLYNMLAENMSLIKDGEQPSADLIGAVTMNALDLSTESKAISEPKNLSDGLMELLEERREKRVEMVGISTGYHILNEHIDGLVPGTLTVVAARPKMGKSTFLSNIATHVAYQEDIPILYIDTEMPFDQWRDRIVAGMSGIEERDIKHGGYDRETWNTIMHKCMRLVEKGQLYHEFMPAYTLEKLTALYKKYHMKHGIGLMVFDYLKEPDSASIERQRKEYQVLGDVTTRLKDLAGTLNIPCLTAVQLNRDQDIADSDRIARYADIICQWTYRTKEEKEEGDDRGINPGSHKLLIKETRRGGMTTEKGIGYNFWKRTLFIEEVDINDQLVQSDDEHESADEEVQ